MRTEEEVAKESEEKNAMVAAKLADEWDSEHIDTLRWANYTESTNEIIQRQNLKAVLIWICAVFLELAFSQFTVIVCSMAPNAFRTI